MNRQKTTIHRTLLFSFVLPAMVILGYFCSAFLAAQEGGDSSSFQLPQDAGLIIRLKNMEEAQAPFVSHTMLFFTYKGNARTRAVGLAFESDGFSYLKIMERNAHNVFIYAMPIPVEGRVAYRYWVDSLWQEDPNNANVSYDNHGIPISVFENTDPSLVRSTNPIRVEDSYDFYAYFEPGEQVYILGSFNNWSPFHSPLKEIEPGKYYIRIQNLKQDDYYYYFWVGGKIYLDPRNFRVATSDRDEKVSIFTVEP